MSKIDSSDLPVAPGQVIAGRYAVSGVLGRGGMGVVLAGRHLELGERVAIKFLHKEHASHADRFFREARAAARIRSEHVVRIFDVGRLPTGEPYIVMEHLDGEDLSSRLDKSGPLKDVQAVADILLDVCQALAEAHAAGIVHRDLKPANIFLAKSPGGDHLVKLLDFGVAKVPEGGQITKTTSMLGSPVYMSPEQLMAARDVDARSDIWSLGIVLYELLTNALPFEGDSLVHLAMVVREKPTPRVADLRPELSSSEVAGIDDVIQRCLSKERSGRYNDVGELAVALASFASPNLAHGISRIQRVLAEGRRGAALASTMPPPSDEPDESEEGSERALALASSGGSGSDSGELDDTALLGSEKAKNAKNKNTKNKTATTKALSASLAAVSTSSSNPISGAQSEETKPRKGAGLKIGLVVVGCVALALIGQRLMSSSGGSTQTSNPINADSAPSGLSAGATVVVEASSPATTNLVMIDDATTDAPASTPTAVTSKNPVVVVRKTVIPAATTSASSATTATPATARPAVNCNPPYTIDEKGLRRPKPECL